MKKKALILIAPIAALYASAVWGQHAPSVSTPTLVKPFTTALGSRVITGTQTMIVNRARVLADEVDGSGTRYFSVRDSDLASKTPAAVAQRLTPAPLTPQQNVKVMDVVVDVRRPLFVTTNGKQPFAIGTVILDGNIKNLQVNTYIRLEELKITKKN